MGKKRSEVTRRRFLKHSVAGGAALGLASSSVAASRRILGASNRVRLGFIGVGNRGTQLLRACLQIPNVEVAALCDVYEPYLLRDRSKVDKKLVRALGRRVPEMSEPLDKSLSRYKDFRQLLDRKDIDAVVIATPDHWHALQTILACEAGKDVYVEKPLSMTITEGRKMVEAARRHKRVVQVGLQRRSSKVYRELSEMMQQGKIGRITVARAYRISNMCPDGIGKAPETDPPEGLDWNMWLGPRAWRPYRDNITPYKFRWWKQYSSQVGNWGVHYFDAIRWMLGEEGPISVSAHGGKFAVDDDRTIPDTLEVVFEFASGKLVIFGQYEASGGAAVGSGEIELRGSQANLYCSASGYRIVPSKGGQFQDPKLRADPVEVRDVQEDPTANHIRNFLQCVTTRNLCHCDLETGHRSNTFALLANIALETRSRIDWDPKTERITNNEAANQLLHYEYRAPWQFA
ncbi:MAG: Gfo/Idh/MocA family oxidoreductase [Acidobacteriota bacterium]